MTRKNIFKLLSIVSLIVAIMCSISTDGYEQKFMKNSIYLTSTGIRNLPISAKGGTYYVTQNEKEEFYRVKYGFDILVGLTLVFGICAWGLRSKQ
jgi:hypothetical protein